MSRNYERDERDYWRRQQRNQEGQDRWSTGDREDEYNWGMQGRQGRNWRNENDMNQGYREQGMQRGGAWQSDRGWDRGNQPNWQGGRGGGWEGERWEGGGYQGGGYQSGGGNYENRNWEGDYGNESRSGRGDWNRNDWNQGMGGGWNQNQGNRGWNQGNWNQGMQGGMQGQHAGRGPRNFKRQDDRIEEDINEQLTRHSMIDASDIEVSVQNGEVTLRGHVDSRQAKRMAEDIAENCFGVKEVSNQIKIKNRGEAEETTGKQRERKAS